MVRTQIQLTEEQVQRLRRRSARDQVSVAELVRQAIDAFTRYEPPRQTDLRDRAARAAGQFGSGVGDTSTRHDDALADAVR